MDDNMHANTGNYITKEDTTVNVVESITGSFKNTNSDHSAIHLGYGYCLHLYYASLAGNATKTYRIKGPTNLFAHIKGIQISASGSVIRAELIKDAAITNPGVEITGMINNLNHNSIRTPQTKVFDSNVTYTGGSVWCSAIVQGDTTGGGNATSRSGGEFIQQDYLEYVTKSEDEDYILKLTNLTADTAAYIQINMFFYEEPKGLI